MSDEDFTKIKIQSNIKLLAKIVVKDIYFISEIPWKNQLICRQYPNEHKDIINRQAVLAL